MKRSIRNRLFLVIYGIVLAFLVGILLLNSVFLEGFYTRSRERTLIAAFAEIAPLDLGAADLETDLNEIESQYNIGVQILRQTGVEPGGQGVPLSAMYDRIYGDAYAIRDGVIAAIMRQFEDGDEPGFETASVAVVGDGHYVAYSTEIVMAFAGDVPDNPRMLALCVGELQNDNLYVYYILTVSIQSIQAAIGFFNTFLVVVTGIFMVLSGIVVWFFSRRFTRPILEMNAVTQNLAAQDFSKRVAPTTHDELGDLGSSINRMSEQLETSIDDLRQANRRLAEDIELKTRIDTMRKEFIANASHELKTPLQLILGYAEALRLPGLDAETVESYLGIIEDESNKMNRLVMSLLKISQLESGFNQFVIAAVPIRELVEETMRQFAIRFTEKNATAVVDVADLEVRGDADAIQTVFVNYLSNALNHVEGERRIVIRTETVAGDRLRVTVANTGKPIPAEALGRIWESFYKVDKARTRAYGGQGLGLSIARTILENLDGTYGVENVEDGVRFWFELPLASPEQDPRP